MLDLNSKRNTSQFEKFDIARILQNILIGIYKKKKSFFRRISSDTFEI